jgi:hypothetical protein
MKGHRSGSNLHRESPVNVRFGSKADIVKIGNDQLVLFLERVECLPK